MENTAVSGNEMYNATVAQQTRTVALEVLGALFVWWLAGAWRLGAMLLFLGFVFLTFMELLHLIAMRQGTANLMKDVSPDELDEHRETIKWLNKAELVRWVSFGVTVALLVLLYTRIW